MKKFARLLVVIFLAAGCSPRPVTDDQPVPPDSQSGRVRVVSRQRLDPNRAEWRDVYVLEDTETGRKYLLVSGAYCGSTIVEIPK